MPDKTSFMLTTMLSTGLVAGCASVPAQGGFAEVQQLIGQRTGLRVQWVQGKPEETAVQEAVQSLLQQALTPDAAVQLALLNNRSLQATYEELGIAQADLVQAGLLQNPVFAGSWRLPGHLSVLNSEYAVGQNFLDFLLLPLRKKLAAAQFEQAKLRVSDAVLRLGAEVKSAYYTFQGTQQMLTMRRTVVEAAEAAAELAKRQQQAGNLNALDLANEQAAYHQAKLDLARSEAEARLDRERLNRLMGFAEAKEHWTIGDQLPDLPSTDPAGADLEAVAVSQRFDVAAARTTVEILQRALTTTRVGLVSSVDVGVDAEHDLDHAWVIGPTATVAVPIFDQRQAARARARAQLRQGQQQLAALEAEIRSEVRTAWERLLAARTTAESYRDSLIPLRTQIVDQEQRHVNYMLRGVYDLLLAKQNEVTARRDYIEAVRDYWVAWSDLERAVGGKLPIVASATPAPAPSTSQEVPEPAHQHHHGGQQP